MRRLALSALAVSAAAPSAAAAAQSYEPSDYADAYFTQDPQPSPRTTIPRAGEQYAPRPAPQVQPAPQPAPQPVIRPQAPAAAPALPRPRATAPQVAPRQVAAQRPARQGTDLGQPMSRRVLRAHAEGRVGWDGNRGGDGIEDEGSDGVLYGVSGGFDRVVTYVGGGAIFFGPFASLDFSSASEDVAVVTSDDDGAGTVTTTTTATELSRGRDLEVGLRAGWASDSLSFYALAALTNAKSRAEAATTVSIVAPDPDDATATITTETVTETDPVSAYDDGWRVGAGAEYSLPGDAYLKAAYRYSSYGDDDTRHSVITGVGLRF